MATLARAIALAAQAHENQLDKAGAPYILHPLRLMFKMSSPAEMIVAVFHDIVEDTDWTQDGLRAEGFSSDVLAAVDALTHREGEDYDTYLARVSENATARKVKLADLEDNMDPRRLSELTDRDIARLRKYHRVWRGWSGPPGVGGAQPIV